MFCPSSWFLGPLKSTLKKLVRPAVAHTRRKELIVKMPMPRECFDEFMSPLTATDAAGLVRDELTGNLVPTETTGTLRRWRYAIRKGSVSDRLFALDSLDPPPPPPRRAPKQAAETIAIQAEEDVYEVEKILDHRHAHGRKEYLVKWLGWDDHLQSTTWEPAKSINKFDLDLYLGKPQRPPKRRRSSAEILPHRGAGCARARLSTADQRRGGVPQSISMV